MSFPGSHGGKGTHPPLKPPQPPKPPQHQPPPKPKPKSLAIPIPLPILSLPTIVDLAAILRSVDTAATLMVNVIDKALEPEHEERQPLKDLRKGVENLKSDIIAYEVLLSSMEKDTGSSLVQRPEGMEGIESLERVLKATRLELEVNSAGNHDEGMMNPFGSEKLRRALKHVLNILKADLPSGDFLDLLRGGNLKDATNGIIVCHQNNQLAFKFVWYHYVVNQQRTRPPSVDVIGNVDGNVWLNSVLDAFRVHPFAVSPERIRLEYDPHTFATFIHNHEAATRHEELARQNGKAWVDDHVRGYDFQVLELDALQTSLFGLLWGGTVGQLQQHSPPSPDDPERPEFERAVKELEKVLQDGIVRSKQQHFSIAFCGMVKAGKSVFLNALMGKSILPSDGLPSTAWPCRIRHVEGRVVPELQFQAKPFLSALKKLQAHQYGRKMQTYPSPAEIYYAPSDPSDEEILLKTIHRQWSDLHAVTRDNLLRFETPEFTLPPMAIGEHDVKILLGQLNDIIRLCQQFDLKFDMGEVDWPLLTVEFKSLRGHQLGGIYEFIDVPDIDGRFRDVNLESLVRRVTSESNAVVPFVSFEEIPHSDWRRLPELVASGFIGRANVVVCTHLDQVSQENMDEQLKTVTKAFWPRVVLKTNRVIPCPLMGLSARDLLDRSAISKPRFEAIWNKDTLGYHCAAKILGAGDRRATYDRFSIQIWRRKLHEELHASGLPSAIQWLTAEMVDSARINALLTEGDTVFGQLREMRIAYKGKLLLEARRIKTENETAIRSYNRAREISQTVLDTWGRVVTMQIEETRRLLEQESAVISRKACGSINRTTKKTLADSGMSLEDMDVGNDSGPLGVQSGNGDISDKLQESSSAEAGCSKVLITETKAQAKDFLRLSERELNSVLETLKREYTAMILDLAGTAKAKLLKVVRGMIRQAELQPLPEDWEHRIGNLARPSLDIDGLAFQEIRGVINSQQLSFLNRQYSIEIDSLHDRFKAEMVDPWIRRLKDEGEKALLGTTEASLMAAKELITSALLEREDRCKRELDDKENLVGEERVEGLMAAYGNLLAAEEALEELFARVSALQT